jgi:hypothetical protein
MIMPDNSFFELMRSVFGKIKTPFKKQQLVNDLETFLMREDIQKAIASYIDDDDVKIIAAVALFGEPVQGELESFFAGELSYGQLQDMIVNLEERFILYRFFAASSGTVENGNDIKTVRLALNPVLEKILLPFTENTSMLFPVVSDRQVTEAKLQPAGILNDQVLAGILSFVSQGESVFKSEFVIRKRIIEAGKTCFPGVDMELALGSLQVLGLIYADGDRLVPDMKYFEDFGSLSVLERSEYCTAAMIAFSEINSSIEILSPLYKNRIRKLINFIHSFIDSLDADFLYPEPTLRRMAEVLNVKSEAEVKSAALLKMLEKTGLIIPLQPQSEQSGQFTKLYAVIHNKGETQHPGPFIAIDSGLTIFIYPEINYADAIKLASVLNIKQTGHASQSAHYELDKDSAVRAFDKGINAEQIIGLLKRLSGGRVDDALIWNLKDWEKRHGKVTLKKGVVLTLAEDRRYLTETMPLAQLIAETLAPGVYLLPEDKIDEAVSALSGAGVDVIARPAATSANAAPASAANAPARSHFIPPESAGYAGYSVPSSQGTPGKNCSCCHLKESFHAILEKIPLEKTLKNELSARIDRRLILCESQLKDADIRYEKLEARLLDYAGKQNIAKQAISQQSLLEVQRLSGDKEGERIFGIPKALEKNGGELVLVIIPSEGENELRIPLAKISLMRRVKKSIFA